jgi:hypothetical protein
VPGQTGIMQLSNINLERIGNMHGQISSSDHAYQSWLSVCSVVEMLG